MIWRLFHVRWLIADKVCNEREGSFLSRVCLERGAIPWCTGAGRREPQSFLCLLAGRSPPPPYLVCRIPLVGRGGTTGAVVSASSLGKLSCFISFLRKTICDALAQNVLQNFVSKSASSPQMHTRWQHQIPCIPCHTLPPSTLPPPSTQNGNFSSGLDLENLKLIFGNWFPWAPLPP